MVRRGIALLAMAVMVSLEWMPRAPRQEGGRSPVLDGGECAIEWRDVEREYVRVEASLCKVDGEGVRPICTLGAVRQSVFDHHCLCEASEVEVCERRGRARLERGEGEFE
jgi:hypothetical protein